MDRSFGSTLSDLRRDGDLSQRKLANDLHVSQALLSHYENGTREPGLPFLCRVCDYFGVTADYILGRTDERNAMFCGTKAIAEVNKALVSVGDTTVHDAAITYLDNAAKRVISLMALSGDEIELAEESAAMAAAELIIVRTVSGNAK